MSSNPIYDILVANRVFDKKGRVNGPRLPHLSKDVIDIIYDATSYLNDVAGIKFKHRIKAIKLGFPPISYCPICGKLSALYDDSNHTIFRRFCSDDCALVFTRTDPETIRKFLESKSTKESREKSAEGARKGRQSQINKFGAAGFARPDVQEKAQLNNQTVRNGLRSKYKSCYVNDIEFIVQGFEPIFLENNKSNFDLTLLSSSRKDVPKIIYDEKRYYPDFFYSPNNTVYEIKSIYTFVKDYETIIKKVKATLDHGFNIQLCLIRKSKEEYDLLLHTEIDYDIEAILLDFLKTYYHKHPNDCANLGQFLSEWLDVLMVKGDEELRQRVSGIELDHH